MKKYLSIVYDVTTRNGLIIPYPVFNLLISLTLCENMLRKNGLMDIGISLDDLTCITTYQGIYQEYINFCNTKQCFLQLRDYYLKVVEDSGVRNNTLFGKVNQIVDNEGKLNNYTSLEI